MERLGRPQLALRVTHFSCVPIGRMISVPPKYLGPDPLIHVLPFDVSKAIHTNLLLVWVLTGFMGAAYWLVPEESRTELHSPELAYAALGLWTARGRDRRRRLPLRLDRREQAARAAAAREDGDRGRHADVPLQPRHDDLERRRASRPPKACWSPASR